MKKCSSCGKEKEKSEFGKFSQSIDGLQYSCKECRKIITKRSYEKNKEKNAEKIKRRNKERAKYKSEWHEKDKKENPEKYKKAWNEQNKKRKEKKAQWYQENKDRIIEDTLEKRRNDPVKRIEHAISNGIRKSLKSGKNGRAWESLVGYSVDELISSLNESSEYTVNDYLNGELQIDHIIPINSYNYEAVDDEFRKCWNLRNLRIIKREDNASKKDKIDKELIIEYNIEDLLPKGVNIEDL